MNRGKTQARRLAVQAMYQWCLNKTSFNDLLSQFQEYETWKKADKDWFVSLVKGVTKHIGTIDDNIAKVADRDIDKIDLIELSILRLGVFELLHHSEVPYKVVLNEYIDLSKVFGSVRSHAYVNAGLDRLARSLRTVEVSAATK